MLISRNLLKKNSDVSLKTTSAPASLSFKGQATKHTTVNGLLFSSYLQIAHANLIAGLLAFGKPNDLE